MNRRASYATSFSRRAFTLIEMLVVIGVIALLISILVPVVSRSRKQAAVARIRQDIQAIGIALDSYQQVWNMYPVFDPATPPGPPPPPATDADGKLISIRDGSRALYTALATRNRIRAGGVPYGPFINVEQFRVDVAKMQIQDKEGNPFYYVPGNPSKPDIHHFFAGGTPSFVNGWALAPPGVPKGPAPMYDSNAFAGFPAGWVTDMRRILGDDNPSNGIIDPGEQPAYTGPFLIWHVGIGQVWGIPPGKTYTDNITNFEIPVRYRH